jgi:DNA polymerase bacteriophage-type
LSYLYLDTETFSATPIELGLDKYTRDAECLIVTFALDNNPVQIWLPYKEPEIPSALARAIADVNCTFVAHYATFDRLILLRCLKIRLPTSQPAYGDVARWQCTRAQAYSHGLPGSLELLGQVVGLPLDQQKLVDDAKLIHTFCVPQAGRRTLPEDAPDAWTRFCNYAIRDTEALREIHRRLPAANYRANNLRLWHLDQLINERGFQFDRQLAEAAVGFLAEAKMASDDTVVQLTGGAVHAATQRDRLLKFLRNRLDIPIDTLRADEVREWLEHDDLDPVVRLLLEQRLEAGKSSGSKYARGLRMLGPRGRQRHTIQFNGAGSTGRDSGRGFQPHNMARPALNVRTQADRIELTPVKAEYIDDVIIPGIYSGTALNNPLVFGGPHEAGALALRHVITAASGNELVVGDWKNIESVITAWCAGETSELDAFAAAFADPKNKALDVYRKQFSAFFGTPVLAVNDTERQAGKVSKLAFGFGGGVGALVTMAAGYQMDLEPLADIVLPRATPEQRQKAYKAWRRAFLLNEDYGLEPKVYQACDVLKQVYRATNSKINQFKIDVGNAVKFSVEHPGAPAFHVGHCCIWNNGEYLIIELPSTRRLLYAQPKIFYEIIEDPEPDGNDDWRAGVVTYMTARGKTWRRQRAWSGLFVENIVQAIANDVLRVAKERVHLDTLNVPVIRAYLETLPPEERTAINLHIHDEISLDVPKGSYPQARLAQMMTAPIDWAPGLPLAADTWINERYGKR